MTVPTLARALLFLAAAAGFAAEPPFAGPRVAGQLEAPPKLETSGLAASRLTPGLLWTHDDSGGADKLHAVTTTGRRAGTVHLRGVKNDDWEDLAAFTLDGRAWLLVADVGDNDAQRAHVLLHFVAEPASTELSPAAELRLRPAATARVRYEDGPRDCEAVAVDPGERAVYLLTKRDEPPRLYRVELGATLATEGAAESLLIARRAGTVRHIPQPTAAQQRTKGHLGRRRAEVTALDFAPDGSAALVLTYGELLLFARRAGEPWAEAFARPPVILPPHRLAQAEAACFSADGRQLFVAGETERSLLRYDAR